MKFEVDTERPLGHIKLKLRNVPCGVVIIATYWDGEREREVIIGRFDDEGIFVRYKNLPLTLNCTLNRSGQIESLEE